MPESPAAPRPAERLITRGRRSGHVESEVPEVALQTNSTLIRASSPDPCTLTPTTTTRTRRSLRHPLPAPVDSALGG